MELAHMPRAAFMREERPGIEHYDHVPPRWRARPRRSGGRACHGYSMRKVLRRCVPAGPGAELHAEGRVRGSSAPRRPLVYGWHELGHANWHKPMSAGEGAKRQLASHCGMQLGSTRRLG